MAPGVRSLAYFLTEINDCVSVARSYGHGVMVLVDIESMWISVCVQHAVAVPCSRFVDHIATRTFHVLFQLQFLRSTFVEDPDTAALKITKGQTPILTFVVAIDVRPTFEVA